MKNLIRWILCATVLFSILLPTNAVYAQTEPKVLVPDPEALSNLVPDPTCISGLECEQLIPFDAQLVRIETDGQVSERDVAKLSTKPTIGVNVIIIDLPQQIRADASVMNGIDNALKDLNKNFDSLDEATLNTVPWFIYGLGVEGSNDLYPIRTVSEDGSINAYKDIEGIGYAAINSLITTFINDYRNNGGNDKTGFIDPFLKMMSELEQIQSIICICEGVDGAGSIHSISDVISAAQAKGVPVHVYQLGAENVNIDLGRKNLEVLARETGGEFIPFSQTQRFQPEALAPIWVRVERAMNPYAVPFTLPNADVRNAKLTVTLSDGTKVTQNVSVTPGNLSLTVEQILINSQSGENIAPIASDANEIAIQVDVITEDGQPITDVREPSIQITIENWSDTIDGTSGTLELTPSARTALEETEGVMTLTIQDKYGEKAVQEINLELAAPDLPPTITFPGAVDARILIKHESETSELNPETMGEELITFSVTDADGNAAVLTIATCLLNGAEVPANLENPSCPIAVGSLNPENENELFVTFSTEKHQEVMSSETIYIDFTLLLPPEPPPSLGVTVVDNVDGQIDLSAELTPWQEVSSVDFALLYPNGDLYKRYPGEIDGQNVTVSIPVEEAGTYDVVATVELKNGAEPVQSPAESVALTVLPAAIPWNLIGLLALLPVLVLVYWLWKRNQGDDDEEWDDLDDLIPSTVQPSTEPRKVHFGTEPVPTYDIFPRATLVWARGGDNLPKEILLPGHQRDGLQIGEWKIGRLYEYSDYIIDDACISKLHVTISEKNGQFYIKDELSSGGTYLNRRPLRPNIEEQLQHNDVINFNAVAYRFKAESDEPDIYRNRDIYTQQYNEAPYKASEQTHTAQTQAETLANDPFGTEPVIRGNETTPIS